MKCGWIFLFLWVISFQTMHSSNPTRVILFIIDAMPSGLHERIEMPHFTQLIDEGVLYERVHTLLPAHPPESAEYPWSSSIPNPVLMTGTIFIGQEGIKEAMIQHSFKDQTTAFVANVWAYEAISGGFDIYRDMSNEWEDIFRDELSVNEAKRILIEHDPAFLRIHCQGPGSAGHRSHRDADQPYTGNIWHPISPFIAQNQYVDQLLGEFVQWLKDTDKWKDTVLFIMGDHGQAVGGGHPINDKESATTQLLVLGSNIRKGVRYPDAELIDIAPTIAYLMGAKPPKYSIGRILREIHAEHTSAYQYDDQQERLNELLLKHRETHEGIYSIENIGSWHQHISSARIEDFISKLETYSLTQ